MKKLIMIVALIATAANANAYKCNYYTKTLNKNLELTNNHLEMGDRHMAKTYAKFVVKNGAEVKAQCNLNKSERSQVNKIIRNAINLVKG